MPNFRQLQLMNRPLFKYIVLLIILVSKGHPSLSQQSVENYMPFDASTIQSSVPVDFDSYYFTGGHRIYQMRFSYNYAVPNYRHMLGISVPVIHAIFNGDFAGFENTTGIGDLRFTYTTLPYVAKKNSLSLKKIAAYLEVTTPTGNERLGRGVGAWVYKPGIIFTYQPDVDWYIFPEVRFQFSTAEVNTRAGSDTTPDLEDPQTDERLQNIYVSLPTTYTLYDWNGWIGLSADYSFSYSEDTYFLFLRTEVGKMITPKTSASIQLIRFIAGQPRLLTLFRARLIFFLK